MSGEFRWVGGTGYMHSVLDYHIDETGTRELSRALYALYKAVQPLERACAYVEACDSGEAEMTVAAVKHGHAVVAARRALTKYVEEAQELSERLIRSSSPTSDEHGG